MDKVRLYAFADEADAMIDGQIKAMLRNGLDGLEVRNVDGVNVSDITLEKAREVRAKLGDAGLSVWSVGSPIGKIGVNDPFEPHLDKLRHTLEVAHELGATQLRMFSFYMPAGENPAGYRQQVIDRLGAMLEAGKDSGVTFCHENEKGIYGDKADRCADILAALPQLKAVYDPANFVQCGEDTLRAWELLAPHVVYLHIKDALADGSIVPAGKGIGNLPQIIAAYRKAGGTAMTLEPHLAVFSGLSGLEREGEASLVGGYAYESNDAAFDAACAALKALL